jgi:hypothetical protein
MKKLKTTTKEFVEAFFDFTTKVCTKLDDIDQKLDYLIKTRRGDNGGSHSHRFIER